MDLVGQAAHDVERRIAPLERRRHDDDVVDAHRGQLADSGQQGRPPAHWVGGHRGDLDLSRVPPERLSQWRRSTASLWGMSTP